MERFFVVPILSLILSFFCQCGFAAKAKCIFNDKVHDKQYEKIINHSSYTNASRKAKIRAYKACVRASKDSANCTYKGCYRLS